MPNKRVCIAVDQDPDGVQLKHVIGSAHTGASYLMCDMQLSVQLVATCRGKLPDSPQETTMLGLNLLRLLVQNRVAEFHTELELIPQEVCLCVCASRGR